MPQLNRKNLTCHPNRLSHLVQRQGHVIKYANLPMVNGRGVVNGTVTGSNGKIGSARTLPARISKELEEVFSAAETPLVGCDEGEETREPGP